MQVVGAFAEHDHAVVFGDEDPAGRLVRDPEAEDVDVEAGGLADVVDGEEVVDGRLRRYYVLSEVGHHALALETHRWQANVAAANRVLAAHPAEGIEARPAEGLALARPAEGFA